MYGLSLLSLHHPPCIVKYVLRTSTSAPVPRHVILSCRWGRSRSPRGAMDLEETGGQVPLLGPHTSLRVTDPKRAKPVMEITVEEFKRLNARVEVLEKMVNMLTLHVPAGFTFGACRPLNLEAAAPFPAGYTRTVLGPQDGPPRT